MASFTVHRLGPLELPRLRELNRLFSRAFDDRATYEGAPPSDAWLERWLAREDVHALVALSEGTIIGGLVAYELPKLEQERTEAYIYDLAVDEAHRRKGVATALIDDLRVRCAARGVWVTFVQADYGDDPAIALYTKLGNREEVLHFDLPMPERGQ
jgi:aminoglycoside 3-N-acetyltransferase I